PPGTRQTISDSEIKDLSELLYELDINKASSSELVIDPQILVPDSETNTQKDLSSRPLFKYVDEASLFSKPTFSALLALLDNYQKQTGQAENFSSAQLAEQDKFLQETISNTGIGRELSTFMLRKGLYGSQSELIQDLKMMWFGLYTRSKGKMDSSGFEHTFLGEIKGGKWTSYPDILGMQFNWDGYFKQVGSAFIGSSPEFDFALYSLCYITRPGKRCRLSLGGKALSIQTYTWDNSSYGDGKKFIGSAYPATP
ncbi:poly(U)-specific endoribonuclease-like, partial [Scleropages formosus]